MIAEEGEVPVAPDGTELSQADLRRLAERGLRDLYFFCRGILRYNLLRPRTHQAYCRFWTQEEDEDGRILRKLGLMPRSHLKTTIGTVGDSLRRIAINPNIRILIGNEAATNSQLMLREAKNHFEQNSLFRRLYPHIIPPSFTKTIWSSEEILVPREAIWREPTISTIGVGGVAVSRHFDLMKLDDLVGEEAFYSPAVMQKAKNWLNHAVSLLVDAYNSEIHLNGTRWAMDDVYSHAQKKMGFKTFLRKAIVMGPDGPEPFFPEQVSMKYLAEILATDPFQYATQYANDPYDTADQELEMVWLNHYTVAPDGDLRWKDIAGQLHIQEVNKLRIYAHVDLAISEEPGANFSAIVVVGINTEGYVFILEVWKRQVDPLALIDKIFEVHDYWQPIVVSVEDVGYQRSLAYYVEDTARRRRVHPRIRLWKPTRRKRVGKRSAVDDRILRTLQPYWSTGMIISRADQFDLIDEYRSFGKAHPDILSALCQGPEYWKSPSDDDALERHERIRKQYLGDPGITGYGI